MKKTLLPLAAAAILAVASASASAEVMLDWKINEAVANANLASVCSSNPASCIHTVDNLTGKYNELLAFDGAGNFAATAVGFFSGYSANEGSTGVGTQLNYGIPSFPGNPYAYRLYATFTAAGYLSGGSAVGTSGLFNLYLDRSADTVFDTVGTGGFANASALATATSGVGDDELIGFSTVGYGASDTNFGTAGSSFNIYFEQFQLTSFGSTYWFDPSPFHVKVWSNGDMDTPFNPLTVATATVVGDMSAVFVVPEPGSLALLGLGLAGLGMAQRRRKQAK